MLNPNTLILFFAQCMFVSATVLMVTLGGIVGTSLSPTPVLVTLPVSLMVVGTALAAIPASLLMQRVGRRTGFMAAALIGMAGCQIGIVALASANFVLFCVTGLLIGVAIAFNQQFRFAAAESVVPAKAGQAVSFILLGSIGGALLGPEFAARSPIWTPDTPFRGAFLAATGCYALALMVLAGFRAKVAATNNVTGEQSPRRLLTIIALPLVASAVMAGVVGQGLMTFVMTATPVSMHVVDGHSMSATAGVIRAHVIAMYLPSLFSGWLIGRLGVRRVMLMGVLAFGVTIGLGLIGHEVMNYWTALVLLGIGWNFLFVGGTTLLVTTYRASERFRVQAMNDFSVFGASALASLLGGAVLLQFGWETVLLGCAVPLVVMVVMLLRMPGRQRA